jgi:hypothetical protein
MRRKPMSANRTPIIIGDKVVPHPDDVEREVECWTVMVENAPFTIPEWFERLQERRAMLTLSRVVWAGREAADG